MLLRTTMLQAQSPRQPLRLYLWAPAPRADPNKKKLAREPEAGSSSGRSEGRSHKVQRATAPVTLRETSAPVRGSFLVDIGEHASVKDIVISTDTGPIDVDLRMTSNKPRPVVIDILTNSGPMRVDVSRAHPRQVLHVACCNYKGPMCVILPDAFTGVIGTVNSTGKVKLSDALLQRSVLMPWSGCEGGKPYQIEPPQLPVIPSSSRSTGSQTAEQLEVGNDRLDVETDRGSITVLLASEQASTFGFVDKSCVIA